MKSIAERLPQDFMFRYTSGCLELQGKIQSHEQLMAIIQALTNCVAMNLYETKEPA